MSDPTPGMIRGEGGGSKAPAQRAPFEAPNTLRSRSTAYIMDIVSEGPIAGFANDLRSVFFDDVPLQAADGSFNFQGVNLVLMPGTPDQEAPQAYAAELNSREVPVGLPLTNRNGPVTRAINTVPLSRVRVTLRFAAMFRQDRSTGDLLDTSVVVRIELRSSDNATWSLVVDEAITGKCTSPYEKSWAIPLHGTGPWEVRCSRVTEDRSDDSSIQDQIFWAGFTEILDWRLSYPDTSYVGLAVDAELFGGSIPNRTYEIKGLKIRVPTNYDPETRAYATTGPGTTGGIWDGTLDKIAWTNNPAWVLYDLMTNPRYGLGSQITPAMVDRFELYEIARYCDELVPDGRGGTEPRFTFDGVINTQEEALNVLQAVAATFRGMVYYGGGSVTASQDRPASPVKLATNANVIDGIFTYEGTALRARHTQAQVLFTDDKDGYRPDIEPVNSPDMARRGIVPLEIVGLGVSRRSQARRIGRWALDVERNEDQTCSYRGGLDHCDVRPGDIVLVADRWWMGGRFGGRVLTATINSVTLDSPIEIPSGDTAFVRVTLPDGSLEERELLNGGGTHTVLEVGTPFSQPPQVESVWMVAMAAVNPRPHRVLAVAEVDLNVYEITALFHDETKYARIEQNLNREPPSFSLIPTGALAPPTQLSVAEFQSRTNGVVRTGVTLSWSHARDPRVRYYQIEARRPSEAGYQIVGTSYSNSIDVWDITPGPGQFRVRSIDALGRVSIWAELRVTLRGTRWVPDAVPSISADARGDRLRISWAEVPQHRSCFYRLRYSPSITGATWPSAVSLADVEGLFYEAPLRDGTYMVRAVSFAGVASATDAVIVVSGASLTQLNVIESFEQAPDWTGDRVGLTVQSGALRIGLPTGTVGTYEFSSPDLGSPSLIGINAVLLASGVTTQDFISEWYALDEVDALASGSAENWSTQLEYRYTLDDPAELGFGTWRSFSATTIEARQVQFRLTLRSLDDGATKPIVTGLRIDLDVPDRVEGEKDVAIAAGGTAITFNEAFRVTPAIVITGQDMQTGDYWTVTSRSRSGFTLRFFNAAGTGVARTADWVAKGTGREDATYVSRKHARGLLAGAAGLVAADPLVKVGSRATLAAAGGLQAQASRVRYASATLTGTSGMSAQASATVRVAAALAGTGRARSWINSKVAKAALAGVAGLAAQARSRVQTRVALSGVSGLAAQGKASVQVGATLGASGGVAAAASVEARAATLLAGAAGLRAIGARMHAVDLTGAALPASVTFTPGEGSAERWGFGAPPAGGRPQLELLDGVAPFVWDPRAAYSSFPNPWMSGFVPGVIGSGGARPDGWQFPDGLGLTHEIVRFTYVDGEPALVFRMSGTTTSASTPVLPLHPADVVPAKPGEWWNGRAKLQLVDGATTGLAGISLVIEERDIFGAALLSDSTAFDDITTMAVGETREGVVSLSITDALTEWVGLGVQIDASGIGVAIDATFALIFPCLNHGLDPIAQDAARNVSRRLLTRSPNPTGSDATVGSPGTPGAHWTGVAGGLTAAISGLGEFDDGCPWVEYTISGTSNGAAQHILTGTFQSGSPLIPTGPGEVWSSDLGVQVMSMSGTGAVRAVLTSVNAAGAVLSGNQLLQSQITEARPYVRQRISGALANASTAGVAMGLRIEGLVNGQAFNCVVRLGGAILQNGSNVWPLDTVPVVGLKAPQDTGHSPGWAGPRLYGLRGLESAKPRVNAARNPRAEGGVDGVPGVPPTSWAMSAVEEITMQRLGVTTTDGIPHLRQHYNGVVEGGAGTFLGAVFPFNGVATAARPAAVSGETWTARVHLGLLDVLAPIEARLVFWEFDANGASIGAPQPGAWEQLKMVRTQGGADFGFGRAYLERSYTLQQPMAATVLAWVQIQNGSDDVNTFDFTLMIGAPQLSRGGSILSALLPPIGSPDRVGYDGDHVGLTRDLIAPLYDDARGLTMSAEFDLAHEAWINEVRDVISLNDDFANAQVNNLRLRIASGNETIGNRATAMRHTNSALHIAVQTGQVMGGRSKIVGSFSPGRTRIWRSGGVDVASNTSVPLPPDDGVMAGDIGLGGRLAAGGTGLDGLTGANQLEGWLRRLKFFDAGVVDEGPIDSGAVEFLITATDPTFSGGPIDID